MSDTLRPNVCDLITVLICPSSAEVCATEKKSIINGEREGGGSAEKKEGGEDRQQQLLHTLTLIAGVRGGSQLLLSDQIICRVPPCHSNGCVSALACRTPSGQYSPISHCLREACCGAPRGTQCLAIHPFSIHSHFPSVFFFFFPHPWLLLFADFRWRSANLTYLLNTPLCLTLCVMNFLCDICMFVFQVSLQSLIWLCVVMFLLSSVVPLVDLTVFSSLSLSCQSDSEVAAPTAKWDRNGAALIPLKLQFSFILLVIMGWLPHTRVFLGFLSPPPVVFMCLGSNFKEKGIVNCHRRNNCIATGLWQVWGWCGWSVELWSADKWLEQKWSNPKASKRDHIQFNQPPYYHHSSKNFSLWRWLTLIYRLIFGFFCQSHVHSCSSFHICTFLSSDNTNIL